MKTRKLLALAAALLVMLLVATGAMADSQKALKASQNGVVYIEEITDTVYFGSDGKPAKSTTSGARGTAFFVGDNPKEAQYLITCAHCVSTYAKYGKGNVVYLDGLGKQVDPNDSISVEYARGIDRAMWSTLYVYFDANDYVEAYLEAYDEVKDVAILKLEKPTTKRTPLKLVEKTSEDMKSDPCYAVGFPGLAEGKAVVTAFGKEDITITDGVISRFITNSGTGTKEIQISNEIYGGNSGGPLVLGDGSVIGVNANSISDSNGLHINYAVNVSEVISLLNDRGIGYIPAGGNFPIIIVAVMAVVVLVLVIAIVLVVKKQPSGGKAGSKGSVGGRVLVFERGALAGQTFELKRNQKVSIGRSPDCQIRFPGDTAGVSKIHCTVVFDGEKVTIRDENSTAGTYIDEQKMKPGVAVTLHRGHPVGLGSKAQVMMLRSKK